MTQSSEPRARASRSRRAQAEPAPALAIREFFAALQKLGARARGASAPAGRNGSRS